MKVLLLIDLQNDFMPTGSLPVAEGHEVVPVANELIRSGGFDLIVASKDWHPSNHLSFAANHQERSPFELIDLNGTPQVLWPEHCVQGTTGAEFHPDLETQKIDKVIYKGTNYLIDSYSAFFDNQKLKETELREYLDKQCANRGISRSDLELYVCGLATDYCVKASAIDAASLGYKTHLIVDASRGVNMSPDDSLNALREAAREDAGRPGVEIVTSDSLLPARDRAIERPRPGLTP